MPRQRAFRRRAKKRLPRGAPRLLAEGDSWFDYPPQNDIVDHLAKNFVVHSKARRGDELKEMVERAEWIPLLRKLKPKCLLLSGGGNDILGSKVLKTLLRKRKDVSGKDELLKRAEFKKQLTKIENLYQRAITATQAIRPGLPIIVHGYANVIPSDRRPKIFFVIPVTGKTWVLPVMEAKGITNPAEQRYVVKQLVGGFNEMLKALASKHEAVRYVDCRPLITENDWADEIHPDSKGFKKIAGKFKAVIDRLPC